MPQRTSWKSVWLTTIVLASLACSAPLAAEVPRNTPLPSDTLQAVLDRIHLHAKDEAWRQGGIQDEVIENWLQKLVASVAKAADRPDFKVPVTLAELTPADPMRPTFAPQSLLIGTNFKRLLVPRNSIILADGNVEVGIPDNSVIIARGVVNCMGAKNSIIIAGAYITSSHDGDPGGAGSGSLLVSRGWLNVGSAQGSILVSGEGTTVARSTDALFVNSLLPKEEGPFSRHTNPKAVKAPDLPLEPMPVHPLAAKIKLLSLIQGQPDPTGRPLPSRTPPAAGAVFRFADRRYVADLDQPIVDEANQPVPDLESWKLSYAGDNVAIFAKGEAQAVVQIGEKPEGK
jgi:hypothetical protein